MFLKNNLRPATASATASGGTSRESVRERLTYSVGNSEAEDFNSFHHNAGGAPKRPAGSNRPNGKKQKFVLDKRVLIIGIAAAAAVLLLAILIIGATLFSSKDITYENNAYIAYQDADGKYHVSVNGTVLDHEFLGNVTLTPALDNSFAYVIDDGGENGYVVWLLKGKKMEEFTPSTAQIQEVVATAGLTPGVVVLEENNYRLYIEGTDQTVVKTVNRDPSNFQISADASTIAYTAVSNDEDGATRRLYIWQDGTPEPIRSSAIPVAVSTYGDYVFAANAKTAEDPYSLYVITTKDMEPAPVDKSTGFDINRKISMNRKGDEILFCITNGETSSTYYYQFKKNGEGESTRLRDRVLIPVSTLSEVALQEKLVGSFLSEINAEGEREGAMYYLNKELVAKPVAEAQGQFSPDNRYFYYIHPSSSLLKQVDLTDDDFNSKSIYSDEVSDFAVTKKGNVYHLDKEGSLRFYDKSDEKNYWRGFSEDISAISFYNYSNELYFVVSDFEEVIVYTSKEGSEKDEAKLGSGELTNVPIFTDPHCKKTYAYYYDTESGRYMLYYTANGRRFKLISSEAYFDTVSEDMSEVVG